MFQDRRNPEMSYMAFRYRLPLQAQEHLTVSGLTVFPPEPVLKTRSPSAEAGGQRNQILWHHSGFANGGLFNIRYNGWHEQPLDAHRSRNGRSDNCRRRYLYERNVDERHLTNLAFTSASGSSLLLNTLTVGGQSVCLANGGNCPAGFTTDLNWSYSIANDLVYNATATTDIVFGSTTSTNAPVFFTSQGLQHPPTVSSSDRIRIWMW